MSDVKDTLKDTFEKNIIEKINDFLIEKADIKIDTSSKNIQFNNSYNQYKPNLDLDTFKIEKSEIGNSSSLFDENLTVF